MPDKPLLEERADAVLEELQRVDVEALTPAERQARGQALDPERELLRRRKIAKASRGNMRRATDPVAALVKRARLLYADEDRPALEIGERLRDDLLRDRGGDPSAAESALVNAASMAMTVAGVAWLHVARAGLVRQGKSGDEVHPAVGAALKALGEMRQALCALGLKRQAKSVRIEDLFTPAASNPTAPIIDVTPAPAEAKDE